MRRIDRYLRAIDEEDVERYHDGRDVAHGKMTAREYRKKWGKKI